MLENLYDWVFHFNPYTNLWNAVPREEYIHYMNGDAKDVKSSKNINDLIELVSKGMEYINNVYVEKP